MVEKGTIGGICHSIYQYAKANNESTKNYDKNKRSSYLQYWNSSNWNANISLGNVAKASHKYFWVDK